MKKNNPQTPILLREAAGTLPKIYARYGQDGTPHPPRDDRHIRRHADEVLHGTEFGVEKSQSLEGEHGRCRVARGPA